MPDMPSHLEGLQERCDRQAADWDRRKGRNRYYHRTLEEHFRFLVPEGARVLEIGVGQGDLLAALKPSFGLGIDASPLFVDMARSRHPDLEFRHGFAETFRLEGEEPFDFIILSDLVGQLEDVQAALENLRCSAGPSTRIIINHFNYLWSPILYLGSKAGLAMTSFPQNWLSLPDLDNLLMLAGFETIKTMRKLLLPIRIPWLSDLVNRFLGNLPGLNSLCLSEFIVARPRPSGRREGMVSVVVACKEEQGNIQELVERLPEFPAGQELIFVDGGSSDGTVEEIQRMTPLKPSLHIQLLRQEEPTGKGGAVRIGFEKARGEYLIILDADLSVAPEDLLKFYELLAQGTGEFVNGSRLVYPLEKEAMRPLNILGNKFFGMAFSYLLEQRMKDTLCGSKALSRDNYARIARNRSYFGEFDPFGDFDLLFGSAKLNLKIVELPVRYHERRYGTTKIHRFRHGVLLLKMCLVASQRLKFV